VLTSYIASEEGLACTEVESEKGQTCRLTTNVPVLILMRADPFKVSFNGVGSENRDFFGP
jgi:hypothetical protein